MKIRIAAALLSVAALAAAPAVATVTAGATVGTSYGATPAMYHD